MCEYHGISKTQTAQQPLLSRQKAVREIPILNFLFWILIFHDHVLHYRDFWQVVLIRFLDSYSKSRVETDGLSKLYLFQS